MARKKQKGHIISRVLPGSIAEEMGVEPGDAVVAVDGQPVQDIFDYRFLMADEEVTVTIEDRFGEQYLLEIEKDEDEDFGVEFELSLMDNYRSCTNGCIFCFIDQMPPGMRKTLYFKDDDSRLSFLQGNYVTLTNMSDEDISRICRFRMEPINISIHTTDPELRVKMLRNKHAGESLSKIKTLKDAGIIMNGQIVLCKGYNDGDALHRTIADCAAYRPEMRSLSIVPVGLTKYRSKLTKLEPFTKEDAERLIDEVETWQKLFFAEDGRRFVYASDEWYILAERPLPQEEQYDGYPQLENGVGMIRSFLADAERAVEEISSRPGVSKAETGDDPGDGTRGTQTRITRRFLSVTGQLAYPYMCEAAEMVTRAFPETAVTVLPIRNDFFGNAITVAGLVTGTDLIAQVKEYLTSIGQEASTGKKASPGQEAPPGQETSSGQETSPGQEKSGASPAERPSAGKADTKKMGCSPQNASELVLLVPGEMLRMDEDVFLDDVTIEDAAKALQMPVRVLGQGGEAFVKMLLGMENDTQNRRQYYEQTDRSDRGQTERR